MCGQYTTDPVFCQEPELPSFVGEGLVSPPVGITQISREGQAPPLRIHSQSSLHTQAEERKQAMSAQSAAGMAQRLFFTPAAER